MKLLDPFAGYRLACGHPFFHIALFTGSWFVGINGDANFLSTPAIAGAFSMLRWGHFALFMLAILEEIASRPSDIPETSKADIEKKVESIERD